MEPNKEYIGPLVEVEKCSFDDDNPKYPVPKDKDGNPVPKVRLTFEAAEGELAGNQASRIMNFLWTPKASLRRFYEGMIGHRLTRGEKVNLREMVDKMFKFFVVETENGEGVKVERALPHDESPF